MSVRSRWIGAMGVLALVAGLGGTDVRAQEAKAPAAAAAPSAVKLSREGDRFTLEAKEATLEEILTRLNELTPVNLSINPALLERKVTIQIKDVPYEVLLQELAGSNAISYEKDEQGNYRIVAALLTGEEKLPERPLSFRDRLAYRRQLAEVRAALKGLEQLYTYAGVLDYDAAKALVQERNRQFEELVAKLAALGPGGARAMQEIYAEAGTSRGELLLIKALGRIEDPEASQVLGGLYGGNRSVSMQREIISAVGKRKDPETLAVLTRIAATEENMVLQAGTVMALALQPESVPTLAEMAQSDRRKSDVRREAVTSLGRIGGEAARTALEQVALQAADVQVRRSAIQELGRSFGDQALGTLDVLLNDADEAIRFNAVKAVGRVKTDAAKVLLARVAEKDSSKAVRETAAQLLVPPPATPPASSPAQPGS